MTQQSILHLVENWDVFTINICCFIAKIIFQILHLHLFGLLTKVGLRSGGQIYTAMQNAKKCKKDIRFFRFLRWLPSSLLDCQIFQFLVANRAEMTNVHCHTNFVKIGQTVDEILRLTIFKVAAICHLGFSNFQTFGHPSDWGG